nr:GNAT family N-acetyltransferase [Sulfobacillus harzensis]
MDKTLPYFNVIMKRRAGLPIETWALPPNFSLKWFVPGDEVRWATIETSVGEFSTQEEALKYLRQTYLPDGDELSRRCLLVSAANGDAVGTITSWWNMTEKRRDPAIHWLAVRPEFQGLGLGKALVSECLKRLTRLEGDRDIFLHTQTWSHRAIAIYIKAGFGIVKRGSFGNYPNDYDEAMPVLRTVLPSLMS